MLLAVGLSSDSICEIDAWLPGWRDRLLTGAFVICDVAVADELPGSLRANVFRIIADESIADLQAYCGAGL